MPVPGSDAGADARFGCPVGMPVRVPVPVPMPDSGPGWDAGWDAGSDAGAGAGAGAGAVPQCRCGGLAGPAPPGRGPAPCGYNGPGRRRDGLPQRRGPGPAAPDPAGPDPGPRPAAMAPARRAPTLAMVVLLVLAAATADEPASTLDVALSAEGQTPEPVSPAKLEASGESDLTTSAQRLGKGLTSVSFEGAERSPTDDGTRESLSSDSSSLDSLNSGSFGVDTLAGEARGGPVVDVPAQSNESEEGVDRDVDSEESLASQGI
ncbi:uncharacterized protein LOC142029593 [Buteo buteo]|uniref:uncharacterized protein LOC142029593 n=1 Tax=Buteo buteo TaxID=30397 RepID=UPI003EBFA0A0